MIFSLFSRKQPPQQIHTETGSNDADTVSSGFPQPQQESIPLPPVSPSPSPSSPPQVAEPSALYSLIRSVPPQTLHTYSLDRLGPNFPEPHDPAVLTALTSFFSTLVPPPRLHCVRCHKFYFELENSDRSCFVAHDDESAEVERVSLSKAKGLGLASEYESHWGCCGRTVEGDGDMGPPDGWCYEGKHTTDIKRARFRADSSPYDDKLIPCSRLRCSGTSGQLLSPSPSSARSHPVSHTAARTLKKRPRPVEDGTEAEEPMSQLDAEKDRSSPKRRRTASRRKSGNAVVDASSEMKEQEQEMKEQEQEKKLDAMDVDPPASSTVSPSKPNVRKPKPGTTADGNESSTSSRPSAKTRSQIKPKRSKAPVTAPVSISSPPTTTPTAVKTKKEPPSSPAPSPRLRPSTLSLRQRDRAPPNSKHDQQQQQQGPGSSPSLKPQSSSASLRQRKPNNNSSPVPIPIPILGSKHQYQPQSYKPTSSAGSLSDLSSVKSSSPGGTKIVQRVAYVEIPKRILTSTASQKTVIEADKETGKETDKDRDTDREDGKCPKAVRVGVGRNTRAKTKTKALNEVVETSVNAEKT